jgi:hypothetical protein
VLRLDVGLAVGLVVMAVELLVPLPPIARVVLATASAGTGVLLAGSARPVLVALAAAAVGVLTSLACGLLAVAGDAQRLALVGGRSRRRI